MLKLKGGLAFESQPQSSQFVFAPVHTDTNEWVFRYSRITKEIQSFSTTVKVNYLPSKKKAVQGNYEKVLVAVSSRLETSCYRLLDRGTLNDEPDPMTHDLENLFSLFILLLQYFKKNVDLLY